MKKQVITLILLLLMITLPTSADTYDALWKQCEAAQKKDLPTTELSLLDKITAKAEAERNYGNLLKAQIRHLELQTEISPDSLKPELERIELKAAKAENSQKAMAAVYYCALSEAYSTAIGNKAIENADEKKTLYAGKAMQNPDLLAHTDASVLEPLVRKGADSQIFGNDLLSIIGYRLGEYRLLNAYYDKAGNRRAALLTALEYLKAEKYKAEDNNPLSEPTMESNYIHRLDSLINRYADLPECGEAALARYAFMDVCDEVTDAQKAEYIAMATQKWAAWRNIVSLKNEYDKLTVPEFQLRMNTRVLPNHSEKAHVMTRNLKSLTLTITRLNLSGHTELTPNDANDLKTLRSRAIASTRSIIKTPISFDHEYDKVTTEIALPALAPGIYLAEANAEGTKLKIQRELIFVTDVFLAKIHLPGKKMRVAVVSATTGQPLPGAKVDTWGNNNKVTLYFADSKGEVELIKTNNGPHTLRAYTTADNYMQKESAWGSYSYYGNEHTMEHTTLFTDRSIYRPGQEVHVTAVCHTTKGAYRSEAKSGQQLKFTLYDANYKIIKEQSATTDEYGVASADFSLPASGSLNGRYSIRCSGKTSEYTYFSVEEYKRPTFEVTFDEVKTEYHSGDTLKVTGRATAYTGTPVQGARVAYSVKRNPSRWWFRYAGDDSEAKVLISDTITTNADGTFEIQMPLTMPEGYREKQGNAKETARWFMPRYFTFSAEAQVTDNAGESHTAETSLTLGTRPTSLAFELPDKVLADSETKVTFRRRNASGKDIDGDITYYFDDSRKKYTAKANTPLTISWSKIKGLSSGKHMLTSTCGTDTASHEFIVFSLNDRRPPVDTPEWLYVSAAEFPRDGKPVHVQIGTSLRNAHVMYSIASGNKELECGSMNISDSIITTPYIYKEEYGDGLLLNYVWVKDGQAYRQCVTIKRPMPEKELEMKWTTFRDKLTPGQKETWTLNIRRPESTDVINKDSVSTGNGKHLIAVLYDKSLDQILKRDWTFNLGTWQNLPSTQWSTSPSNWQTLYAEDHITYRKLQPLTFSTLSYDLRMLGYSGRYYGEVLIQRDAEMSFARNRLTMMTSAKEAEGPMLYEEVRSVPEAASDRMLGAKKMMTGATKSAAGDSTADAEDAGSAQSADDEQAGGLQIRENLQETAFYYPSLTADKQGNVSISFTLPESVTTWQFRGFAHDKAMNHGMITAEAVASKKVMVVPNVPRFVRTGDNATISTRVINITDTQITTRVRLDIIDPMTDKTVASETHDLTIQPNATASQSFRYQPDGETQLLICRITAEGKDYSDGEQHYLPVLPDRERVTNTVPFTMTEKGKKEILIDSIFPDGASGKKLTVEYTANPTWLMIQALPYASEPNEKDAVSLTAAYYSNMLGKFIMKQSPVIKKVVELWKTEGKGDGNSLTSALEKNQELKDIILNETPWVMDADRESEQKRMLIKFFDESQTDYRISKQLEGIRKLQNSDGSWSWWPGMAGSPHMTGCILEMLIRLNKMTGDPGENADMIKSGLKYLGDIVVEEYKELKKQEKELLPWFINDSHAIQYLYMNALCDRQLPAREKPVKDFILNYLRTNRQRNIFAKARMAVILSHDGKSAEAREYIKSIKEFSVSKPDMGRYFDTQRAGYSWMDYRIPTQTAAIEALRSVTPEDKQTIEEMRLWLLQSKRTQAWDTPVNSANAVYAFFDSNYRVLDTQTADGKAFAITLDGKQLKPQTISAGIGYAKLAEQIGAERRLTIEKRTDGASWGAAYAQFYQPLKEIADAASGLTVKREIMKPDAEGKVMATTGNAAQGTIHLTTGDRIRVKITITADRDYDFVQVTDKRAACLEPANQLSGYGWGYYCSPKDNATNYFFDCLSKGTHVIESEYFVDRSGTYTTGTCTAQCAYSPEFAGRTAAKQLNVE